ncbi:hypothetical protein MG293_008765 [Ovis ammon polii]|uniref:Testis expressed 45 n=1 Tax=Ovis ammon polii TaxID=230172 RepID=A0AAD4U6X9_OVIAM|nr:hypothetical protein MG293_008765 [Ovis ammon polii]
MAAGALLPCPVSRLDFLKASHFALGPDARLHADAKQPTSHRDFPAYSGSIRGPLCPPPPCSSLFQKDARWAGQERLSETRCAYEPPPPVPWREQERELARERTLATQASHLHLQAEARARTGLSTARGDYSWPEPSERAREHTRGARLIFDRDSLPSGDRAKLRIPPTTYREFFPLHDLCLKPREPACRLCECAPRHPRQFHRHTYSRGKQGFCSSPPAHYCAGSLTISTTQLGHWGACPSLPFPGSCKGPDQMDPLPASHPLTCRYDKAQASAHVHCVNIRPGDGLFHDRTTKREHFYAREPGEIRLPALPPHSHNKPFFLHHDQTPESHILEGNGCPGPGSLTTSTHFFYRQPLQTSELASRHVPHETLQSHITLGEPSLLGQFFQTSMGTDYLPPGMPKPPKAPNLHLQRSNLPEGTGGERGPAHLRKPRPTPATSAALPGSPTLTPQCKYSHLEPPLGQQRFFSTLNKDEFTFKYQGPAVLRWDDFQESHLPLGSLHQWGCGARKVDPRAAQTPIYPCPSQQ